MLTYSSGKKEEKKKEYPRRGRKKGGGLVLYPRERGEKILAPLHLLGKEEENRSGERGKREWLSNYLNGEGKAEST